MNLQGHHYGVNHGKNPILQNGGSSKQKLSKITENFGMKIILQDKI